MKKSVRKFFIGWDVGGWNCDHNPKSRDALVIVDDSLALIGQPWRGNLREVINDAKCAKSFVAKILECCKAGDVSSIEPSILSIDIPLGFSRPFIDLLTEGRTAEEVGSARSNPYLHRQAEFFLFEKGLQPLSPLKDMIGSQATKGIHVLNRFGLIRMKHGFWTDGVNLEAIETYPSACRKSDTIRGLVDMICTNHGQKVFDQPDMVDALICALVGWLFHTKPNAVIQPTQGIDPIEGWIYVPLDGLSA